MSKNSSELVTLTLTFVFLHKMYAKCRQVDRALTTTTIFISQNDIKPEKATAHQSWLFTVETQVKHKH